MEGTSDIGIVTWFFYSKQFKRMLGIRLGMRLLLVYYQIPQKLVKVQFLLLFYPYEISRRELVEPPCLHRILLMVIINRQKTINYSYIAYLLFIPCSDADLYLAIVMCSIVHLRSSKHSI